MQSAYERARALDMELTKILAEYSVPAEYLSGSVDIQGAPVCESLAYVVNCEGDVEDNIKDIEEAFVWYVNHEKYLSLEGE